MMIICGLHSIQLIEIPIMDNYQLLGVNRGASKEEIKKHFIKKI
jgi:preprotein translocase subunit Sec63